MVYYTQALIKPKKALQEELLFFGRLPWYVGKEGCGQNPGNTGLQETDGRKRRLRRG